MHLNEHQRRAYLEALGVDVWLPRAAPERLPETPVADRRDAPAPGALGWDALRACVSECTRCGLHRERTQTVFGVGDPSANWMLIGEGPGAEEDRRGEPFVGRAGKLLDEMLRAIGLARECVYIANTVKCRPPGNRSPSLDEAAACRPFLDRQIEIVEPAIIVALGKVAAQNLLGSDEPVGRLRGRRHQFRRIPLVVTYHPAYLLRSPAQKRLAWDDLCLARDLVAASVV
jgi:uracil-DNA glycosylase